MPQVRYVMRSVFGDPKKAPPLVEKLNAEGLISILWRGEGSLVEDLLHSMAPHVEADLLSDLKSKIQAHDPSGSDDIQSELRKSLLWQVLVLLASFAHVFWYLYVLSIVFLFFQVEG